MINHLGSKYDKNSKRDKEQHLLKSFLKFRLPIANAPYKCYNNREGSDNNIVVVVIIIVDEIIIYTRAISLGYFCLSGIFLDTSIKQ